MEDTLYLYGDIGSSYWFEGITAKDVSLQLKDLDISASKHTIRFNSPGGLVDEGLAMMNVLRVHKTTMKAINPSFELETVCDGYCMSAATCPFMAGDIRTIALGGVFMIHDAWSYAGGDAKLLRKIADDLDKLSENAANIYAALCTPSKDRTAAFFRNLMTEETYFIGAEAVDVGLATQEDKASEAVLCASLTPENLKGHYVQRMTKDRIKTTYNRPINPQSMKKRDDAIALLAKTAAELGKPLDNPKIVC